MPSEATTPRIAYVLKVYPRFSETFVVTEILAREAAGEDLVIFSLRSPADPRFHPELARVAAPVHYLERPTRASMLWDVLGVARTSPTLLANAARHLDDLLAADVDDAAQAVLLAAAIERERITHLHAHFASCATSAARLASLLTGVPYSFTAHAKDLFHETVERSDVARKLRNALFAVTVSDFNLAHLRGEYGPDAARVHRLYNGIELERFPFVTRRAVARGAPVRIAAVGRLVEKKGFGVLIDAVAALRDEGIAVEVDIAGGGELAGALAARIEATGQGAGIRLRGPLPQHEIADLLRDADVLAAPCLVAPDGNADGLPTVLLEAMATGTPCVSTAVTGIPEVIRHGDTGILVRPGSAPDLCDALRAIARGEIDTVGMAERARSLIEARFDSTRQAAALRALTRGDVPSDVPEPVADLERVA